MTDDQPKEGWGYPLLSRKSRYFRDGISLCRKWAYTGRLDTNGQPCKTDCKACTKKRAKEKS